jgi:serine protease AprX
MKSDERGGMDMQRMRGKGPGRRTPRRFRTTGAVTPQRALVGAMAVSLLLTALILPPAVPTAAPDQLVPVIVRGQKGSVDVAERLVLDAGGEVGRRTSIIDGFAAKVPISELIGLDGSAAIISVTPDASVRLLGNVDGIDPNKHPGSWLKVAKNTRGNALRHPDLVAPGKSIVSLRDPGSFVDEANPGARVGATRFIKGSGSSQAAAIVSGAVATILEQHPELTPDQVKALLMQTAVPLPNADPVAQGEGLINLHRAREAKISTIAGAVQTWPRSTGLGSLQLAPGSVVTEDDGTVLEGEQTVFADTWDATAWASSSWDGTSWSGGDWSARTWSGDCWCGASWSARTWSARTWSGSAWSGREWSGRTWSAGTWSGSGWSAGSWGAEDAPSALSSGAWTSTLWGD